jgi:hypothetical protein
LRALEDRLGRTIAIAGEQQPGGGGANHFDPDYFDIVPQ